MNNKKYIGAFFAILMTLCLFAAGQIVSAQSPVVQTVNGVEFTADQYIESAQFYRFNLIQQYNYYLTIYRRASWPPPATSWSTASTASSSSAATGP